MLDLLYTIVSFVVALGLLIAVHEFGHFWVAKKVGVKVLRFSIGFGQPIWKKLSRDGETEYVIASIPLGGYVKMLDEREGEVQENELHRAFNRKPVAQRFAVVAAGPIFNLLFAVFAYWLTFIIGVPGMKAILGDIPPGTIAYDAGLRNGQIILSVENEATPTWGAAMERLLPKVMLKEPLTMTVEDHGVIKERTLHFEMLNGEKSPTVLVDKSGIRPYRPKIPAVVEEVSPGSPAERAGFEAGDEIVMADGQPISEWDSLVEIIQRHPGETIPMTLKRGAQYIDVNVRPDSVTAGEGPVGKIGVGVRLDEGLYESLHSELRYGPVKAVGVAITKTWDMAVLTLKIMADMLVGEASVENISGPISIAQYAKSSAASGLSHFIGFLAIVSLSLGVLNLLPVPVLDGGHLMYYLVEMVKGSPVSETVEQIGQKIGLALILALMFLAIYNDLARLVR